MSEGKRPERAPWNDFPPVIRNGDLKELEREPEYQAAKAGDQSAALDMAERLVRPETVEAIREVVGDRPAKIVPVLAREAAGNNKIPLATAEVLGDRLGLEVEYNIVQAEKVGRTNKGADHRLAMNPTLAEVLGDRLGLEVEYNIVQAEKVGRTNKGADHRLAMNPTFDGAVEPGRPYVLVDDTLSMGGTISSLRGYIENRGGQVLGAAVMTAHPGAVDLAVKPKMLADIERKHGHAMNNYWKEEFGYGIEQLTQGEAGHLRKAPTVDAIRDRITAARNAAGWAMDESRAGQTPATESESVKRGPHQDKADAFKQLSSKELLEQYPNDPAIEAATAVQAVADKFALEQIPDKDNRDRFLEGVRDRIADNLEHGRDNTAPRILDDRSQGHDDQER